MSSWMLAIALRPFFFLAVMALIVIPIELALRRVWPEGSIKRVLFGRNFDKRHPRLWVVLVVVSYFAVGLLVWAYLALREAFR